MTITNWNIESQTGYRPITTYYTDFSIAENFGTKAILETYETAKKELAQNYMANYKELTELVMVLNWKTWEHYKRNENYTKLYNTLWEQLDNIAIENLKDKQLTYFFDTTD